MSSRGSDRRGGQLLQSTEQPAKSHSPRFDTLPAEIIKQILCYLAESLEEVIYDEKSGTTDAEYLNNFKTASLYYSSLGSRSVTCWSREVLLASPVLRCVKQRTGSYHENYTLLLRTLLENRDLGTKIERLTIFLPGIAAEKNLQGRLPVSNTAFL